MPAARRSAAATASAIMMADLSEVFDLCLMALLTTSFYFKAKQRRNIFLKGIERFHVISEKMLTMTSRWHVVRNYQILRAEHLPSSE
jgi:hypothetical protein